MVMSSATAAMRNAQIGFSVNRPKVGHEPKPCGGLVGILNGKKVDLTTLNIGCIGFSEIGYMVGGEFSSFKIGGTYTTPNNEEYILEQQKYGVRFIRE